MKKLPISAMVVGLNEEKLLTDCFRSINFCDDIHYTDLGSIDSSITIAEKYAQYIYHRKPVPSCEMIQAEIVHYTKNEWVIFIDPDEVLDEILKLEILNRFEELTSQPSIGGIVVPWQFYFKKKRLRGTAWGGRNNKFFLVNKNRFEFEPVVHYGRKLKPEYKSLNFELNQEESNVLHHYWMNNWRVFVRKHRRYLINEGQDRYNIGMRTNVKSILLEPFKEFKKSFWILKGYKDGYLGLLLSFFWAWYQTISLIGLFKYQLKKDRVR